MSEQEKKSSTKEMPTWLMGLLLGLSIALTGSLVLAAMGVHLNLWKIP